MSTAYVTPQERHREDVIVVIIGVFKVFKSLLLIAATVAVLKLLHRDVADQITQWAHHLHVAPGNTVLRKLLVRVSGVSVATKEVFAGILAAYAALFMTEGVGLLLRQHWAEWMTVITTSLLLPLEVYELIERLTVIRTVALPVNVAVVVYLIWQVRQNSRRPDRNH